MPSLKGKRGLNSLKRAFFWKKVIAFVKKKKFFFEIYFL